MRILLLFSQAAAPDRPSPRSPAWGSSAWEGGRADSRRVARRAHRAGGLPSDLRGSSSTCRWRHRDRTSPAATGPALQAPWRKRPRGLRRLSSGRGRGRARGSVDCWPCRGRSRNTGSPHAGPGWCRAVSETTPDAAHWRRRRAKRARSSGRRSPRPTRSRRPNHGRPR